MLFDWLRPRLPSISPKNPGRGTAITAAFADGERTWEDCADLQVCLSDVLRSEKMRFKKRRHWLELDGGLMLHPQLVSFHPLERGGVQTVTTVEYFHPTLVPSGAFEYQHSAGDNLQFSLLKGFDDFVKLDLAVMRDSLRGQLEVCTALEMDFPAGKEHSGLHRRALFGPVTHAVSLPSDSAEEHPFCPCCLFCKNADAVKELLETPRFLGIRFFAMRDEAGGAQADCRINGEDWAAGKEALIRYIKTWPNCGVEFRKQFVAVHSRVAA